jgi:predicted transcriptional regulator
MARPRIKVDTDFIERLASIGCTVKEIATAVNISVDTMDRNYAEFVDKGRERGKTSLRKKQFELALNGNVTMLIWLGKQVLGQKDKQEVSSDGAAFKVVVEDYVSKKSE